MRFEILEALRAAQGAKEAVAVITVLGELHLGEQWLVRRDGTTVGTVEDPELLTAAAERVNGQWLSMAPTRATIETAAGPVELFIDLYPPPPRLIVVGAVHAAISLVRMAKDVGFETIVVDPRTAFATAERFVHADLMLHDWPDEALEKVGVDGNTFVALLSHDFKLDIPALRVALPKARYIGALGSKKTHGRRLEKLRQAGAPEELFSRIHNPIGLDLGGRRAEEIAVAVLAEIIAVSHGRDARPLP